MSTGNMNLTLKIWRQKNDKETGKLVTYPVKDISPDMSFLEMFDVLNEELITKGDEPIAFDHDCREGICGMCSMFINGRPHGPKNKVTTCQLHMRSFKNGDTIVVEPWRAAAFPVIKDLTVDRSAFTEINPPFAMILSNAERSTVKSFITGNAAALQGSTTIVSPFLKERM